jgi:hypothetical protein
LSSTKLVCSDALMKANFLPAPRTLVQSIVPCQWLTSIPSSRFGVGVGVGVAAGFGVGVGVGDDVGVSDVAGGLETRSDVAA